MTRRRKGASDSCFYYKWLDKALCDLQAARLLLTYGGDHYNIAFHCQQAIEKALKGYLLFRTGRHFDGHNLTYLCRQAIQLDSKVFSEYLDESAALNDLYIETRYPTALPFEIDELEVRRYLDMAERMAKRHIPMTMEDWAKRIDLILEAGGNDLLTNAGKVTTELAKAFAEAEFEKYRVIQDRLFQSDFDRFDSETLFPTDFNPDNT